jgi:hypothetical protein
LADGELVGDRSCIGERPGQAIEFGDHKSVALSTGSQGLAQTGSIAIGARQSVVNVDPTGSYPERGETVALGSEVLLISGHSGISDE